MHVGSPNQKSERRRQFHGDSQANQSQSGPVRRAGRNRTKFGQLQHYFEAGLDYADAEGIRFRKLPLVIYASSYRTVYRSAGRMKEDFPWEQLTGQPIIYASMGTLQNGVASVYHEIVTAVEKRKDMQVVL